MLKRNIQIIILNKVVYVYIYDLEIKKFIINQRIIRSIYSVSFTPQYW